MEKKKKIGRGNMPKKGKGKKKVQVHMGIFVY